MRGSAIILAAVLLAVALVPIAEAEAPAEVYFFDQDGTCTAKVYLLPGDPIKQEDIPWRPDGMDWYDEDGRRIVTGTAFDSGSHTAKLYYWNDPPEPSRDKGISPGAIAGLCGGVLVAFGIGCLAYIIYRRR